MKQGCTKGKQGVSPQTQHTAASVLITPGLFTGKGQLPRSGNLNSYEAPNPDWTLPTLPLRKDTELAFPCPFIRIVEKALGWPDSQHIPEKRTQPDLQGWTRVAPFIPQRAQRRKCVEAGKRKSSPLVRLPTSVGTSPVVCSQTGIYILAPKVFKFLDSRLDPSTFH